MLQHVNIVKLYWPSKRLQEWEFFLVMSDQLTIKTTVHHLQLKYGMQTRKRPPVDNLIISRLGKKERSLHLVTSFDESVDALIL